MANALSLNGNGYATAPLSFIGFPSVSTSAVELYIKTARPHGTLFSSYATLSVSGGNEIGATSFAIYLDTSGTLNIRSFSRDDVTQQTTTNVVSFPTSAINLTDNNWHQVSLYTPDGTSWQCFIDGNSVAGKTASDTSPGRSSNKSVFSRTYGIGFGADTGSTALNLQPVAPGFVGAIGEIRLWSGGNPSFVLAPAFSLNVGVPVSPKAPNLMAYWPFWTSNGATAVDLVGGVALTLTDSSIAKNMPAFYDPLSELIANGTRAPYDEFTQSGRAAAFQYLMTQIGMNETSPQQLRAQYADFNLEKIWSDVYTKLENAQYNNSSLFTEADFNYVKGQLLQEISALDYVLSYYDAASRQFPYITQQFNNAAAYVYTTTIADVGSQYIAQQQAMVNDDASNVVNTLAGALSVIPSAKAIAGSIKVIWAVISWATKENQPDFDPTMSIQASFDQLENAAILETTELIDGLQSSLSTVIGDWGLMNAVNQNAAAGKPLEFAIDLSTMALTGYYYSAVLLMTRIMVASAFKIYCQSQNQYGGWNTVCNWIAASPTFSMTFGQGQNPFHPNDLNEAAGRIVVGYEYSNGAHEPATYTSLPDSLGQMLTNAAANLTPQPFAGCEEVNTWPIPLVEFS